MLFFNSPTHVAALQHRRKHFHKSLRPTHTLQNGLACRVTAIAASTTSLLVSGNLKGRVQIHNLTRLNEQYVYSAPFVSNIAEHTRGGVTRVEWRPHEDNMFASLGGSRHEGGSSELMAFWETETLVVISEFPLLTPCQTFAWAHEFDNIVAVGGNDGQVTLLDLDTGNGIHKVHVFAKQPVTSCAWSPRDANIFACGSRDGQVKLFDVRKMKEELWHLDEFVFEGSNASSSSASLASSATKNNSASHEPKRVRTAVGSYAHRNMAIRELAFVDGGRCILTGASDSSLRLWRHGSTSCPRIFMDYPQVGLEGFAGNRLAYNDTYRIVLAPAKRPNSHALCAFTGWDVDVGDDARHDVVTYTAHVKPIDGIVCRNLEEEIVTMSGEDGMFVVWRPELTSRVVEHDDNDRRQVDSVVVDDDW